MKKIITLLLSIVLVFCTAVIPSVSAQETAVEPEVIEFGNIDKAGNITASDALLALQVAVGKIGLEPMQRTLANVDMKSGVTASDALLILQYAVGKIKEFSAVADSFVISSPYTDALSLSSSTDLIYLDGPIMVQQEEASYSAQVDVPADSLMGYVRYGGQMHHSVGSWMSAANNGQLLKNKKVDVMIAINRAFGDDYYSKYPDRAEGRKDSQTDKNGNPIVHAADGDYMVPTQNFIEYKWQMVEKALRTYDIEYFCFEEPELWHASGYSVAFKEEWEDYYGTEWEDQTSSAEALYKTSLLKVFLFERIIDELATRIHEYDPDIKIVLASHATQNYMNWAICSNIGTLANMDCVDGVIGQTWSDTIRTSMKYNGEDIVDGFLQGYVEYSAYPDLVNDDQWMFALSDGASDGGSTWESAEEFYKYSIVSQLLHADINRFEYIWPSRAYVGAPKDYKTIQLNVTTAQMDLAGKATELYAGTQGIYLAQSDSESWQFGSDFMVHQTSKQSINAMSVPLVKKGIPLKTLSLEQVSSADDLKGVNLLILSYDCMKPTKERVNNAIADWVKAGGQVLYLGGHDGFENIEDSWWGKKGMTPFEHLLSKLGLNDITVGEGAEANVGFSTAAGGYITGAKGMSLDEKNASYTATFSGKGYKEILSVGGKTLGFTAEAGEGNITVVGLPSSYYADFVGGELFMRELAEYALVKADIPYIESNTMLIKRGDYVIAQNLEGQSTIKGKYIDLFSKDIDALIDPVLDGSKSVMYKDISSYLEGDTARLVFASGVLSDLSENADSTTLNIGAPYGTPVTMRFALNGNEIDTVTVNDGQKDVTPEITVDEASGTVLVKAVMTQTKSLDVTVSWK